VNAADPASDTDPLPGLVSGLSRQNSVYRRTMAACDKLAAAAVQGADVAELARIFAATAGKTVILLDPELRPQAQAASAGVARDWDPGDASLDKLLRLLTAEHRPLRVPPVPGAALARTQTSLELGLRYRGAIVDSLVSGHFLDSQDAPTGSSASNNSHRWTWPTPITG